MPGSRAIADSLLRLDELTRRLRRECPWDREQDERSIVPHTVEEAYELADAAHSGDDAKLLDELGDVLFQVYFLALLMSERGAGDLAAVADHCAAKLIYRHPHVFGEDASLPAINPVSAGEVLRNWDAIKRTEPGRGGSVFDDVPENLPALTYARKLQRRAASHGAATPDTPFGAQAGSAGAARAREELVELEQALARRDARIAPTAGETADPPAFRALGDALFALVAVARELALDPELALRAAAQRFRDDAQA